MMGQVMALLERSASPPDTAAGARRTRLFGCRGRDVSAGDRRSSKLLVLKSNKGEGFEL